MELIVEAKNRLLANWSKGPLYRSILFWCLGLFMVTFDRILFFEVRGMTIKSFYFVFLTSNIFLIQYYGVGNYFRRVLSAAKTLPWLFLFLQLCLLLAHSAVISLHHFKSFVYSAWLWFDVLMIALPVFLFRGEEFKSDSAMAQPARGETYKRFIFPTLAACIAFLSFVTVVDYLAFFVGKPHGVLGFSQYDGYHYNWPRPSAYSFEPSYIAMFFALGITLIFSEFVTNKSLPKSKRLFLLGTVILAGISMLMFFSRSGLGFWVLLFIGSYFLFVRHKFIRMRTVMIHAGLIVAVVIAFFTALPQKEWREINYKLVSSLSTGTDGSMSTRIAGVRESLDLAYRNLGMGVGMGNSYAIGRLEAPHDLTITDFGKQNIQNIWFEVMGEQGFLLFALFFLFVLSFAYKMVRAPRYAEFIVQQQMASICFILFFLAEAHFLPNVCRSDMWVWVGIFGYFLPQPKS